MKNHAGFVGLVAILIHAIGMAAYVHRMQADFTILTGVGQYRLDHFPIYGNVTSPLGPHGYDGTYYYALAHAPFAKYGPEIDNPPGRQLRILFPIFCYLASFGQESWLIYVLPSVNLLMIGLLTWLGAKWCRHQGLNVWFGLTLPIVLDAILPSLRSLTDPTAMTMAFWFLFASMRRHSPLQTGLAAFAAVLAREQNLAILAMTILYFLWQKDWTRAAAIAVAIGFWLGWVEWLRHFYGKAPFLPTKGNFAPPGTGLGLAIEMMMNDLSLVSDRVWMRLRQSAAVIACLSLVLAYCFYRDKDRWREWMPHIAVCTTLVLLALPIRKSFYFQVFPAVVLVYLLTLAALTLYFTLRLRREALLPLGMAWGGLALAALAGPLIYVDYWSWGRAFFWLPMGVWTLVVQARWRTVLCWSGLVAYIPLAMVLNR